MRSFDYSALERRDWDSGILDLAERIGQFQKTLPGRGKGMEARLERLHAQARLQSAEFSNRIEGNATSGERLEMLFTLRT